MNKINIELGDIKISCEEASLTGVLLALKAMEVTGAGTKEPKADEVLKETEKKKETETQEPDFISGRTMLTIGASNGRGLHRPPIPAVRQPKGQAMNILERMNDVYVGLRATMVGYDPHGYNGRDKHPDNEDIGFAGVILKVVEVDDTLLGDGYDEDDLPCCLLVQAANGRQLELMTHECDISD